MKTLYPLYTATLEDTDTGIIHWPCMLVITSDGMYADSDFFTIYPNDHILVRRESGATCTMYRVHARYEVNQKVTFGVVERVL